MEKKYVLITPAHNEEQHIEAVIKSVLAQTILPQKWVIVDDGSTDGTGSIIQKYSKSHDYIIYHRLKREKTDNYYTRRAHVFLSGHELIKALDYDFLGSLDADITLEPTYYESIMEEFDKNPEFGILSGIYIDKIGNRFRKVFIDKRHTPGAIQMFRRKCYDEIGGYIPQKYGGDDTCAEIMARMKGWQTRSFQQYKVIHHRPVGMGDGRSILQARFWQGLTEYGMATHPVFMLAKSIRRVFIEEPYCIGSLMRLAGFSAGYLRGEKRQIPSEVVSFVRKEQIRRLFACIGPKR
jgi:GT2 family glycosyltransferase